METRGAMGPQNFTSACGTAVAHGNIAYFSHDHSVYSYEVIPDKWTILQPCKHLYFGMAVVRDRLTAIGGCQVPVFSNTEIRSLLSFLPSENSWVEVLPPMTSGRVRPATVATHSHLVVAGGEVFSDGASKVPISKVEVLDTETLQWYTAQSLPPSAAAYYPQMALCAGRLYFVNKSALFSCSLEHLVRSCKHNSANRISSWSRQADVPVADNFSLAVFREHVLALGGSDDFFGKHPTAAIHCYDTVANSWSVIGQLPTPRSIVLAAVLISNEVVVVGGCDSHSTDTSDLYIGL